MDTLVEPKLFNVDPVVETLYKDGICGTPGAFSEEFVQRMFRECVEHYAFASTYEEGTANRGRNRRYFAMHPEETSFAVEVMSHPWFVAVNEMVHGPDWVINEFACDISWPGSLYQPWHRDFPRETGMDDNGKLTATAFNIAGRETTDENGPLELVHGTHGDEIPTEDRQFPDNEGQARYENHPGRTLKYAKVGSMSVRSPLALHRGTPNRCKGPMLHTKSRPVLVVTTYSGSAEKLEGHLLPQVTESYLRRLPSVVREHLNFRVVTDLEPIRQTHTIEGLKMGDD